MSKEPDTILEPFLSGNDIRINEGGEEVVDTTENKNSGSDEKLTAEDGGDQGDNGINNIFNSELKSSSSLPTESITNTSTKDQVDDDESNKNNPIKFSSMVDDQKPVSPSSNIRRNSSSQFNPTTSTVPISQDEIYFQSSIDSKAKAINESSNQPVQMPSTSNLSSRQTPDVQTPPRRRRVQWVGLTEKDTLTKQDSQCQTSSPSPTKNPNAPYIRHQNRLSPNQSIQSQSNKSLGKLLGGSSSNNTNQRSNYPNTSTRSNSTGIINNNYSQRVSMMDDHHHQLSNQMLYNQPNNLTLSPLRFNPSPSSPSPSTSSAIATGADTATAVTSQLYYSPAPSSPSSSTSSSSRVSSSDCLNRISDPRISALAQNLSPTSAAALAENRITTTRTNNNQSKHPNNRSSTIRSGRLHPTLSTLPQVPSLDQLLHQAQINQTFNSPQPRRPFLGLGAGPTHRQFNPYFPPILSVSSPTSSPSTPTPNTQAGPSSPLSSPLISSPSNAQHQADLAHHPVKCFSSYFSRIFSLNHNNSRPSGSPSGSNMITPNSSRPGTPDSDLDIPPGERDGLPSNPNRRPRTFTREAAQLVSLHRFRFGGLNRQRTQQASRNNPNLNSSSSASHNHPEPRNVGVGSRNPSLRENRNGGVGVGVGVGVGGGAFNPFNRSFNSTRSTSIPGGVGNGVLSSLLHLYNHPSSAHSSSATLINYGSYDEDSECGGSRSNHSHRKTLRSGSASGHSRPSHDHAQSYQIQSQSQESSVPTVQTGQFSNEDEKTDEQDEKGLELGLGGHDRASNQAQSQQPTSFKNSSLELFRGALAKVKNSHFNSDRTTYQQKNNPTECVIGALQAGAIGLGAAAVPSVKDLAQDPEKNSATNNEQADQAPLQSDNPYHQEYSPTTIHRNYSQPNLRGRLRSPGTILSEDEDREGTSNHGSSSLSHSQTLHNSSQAPDSDCNHDSNGRSTGNYHHRSSSSASISGSIFKQKIGKSPSIANLKALGDALRPTNFHNESSVLRAKKTSLNSVPGTPRDDLSSEKGRQHTLSRRKRERRRQEEIFITMHVAAILQRQEFILLLTRALMMFGGPSHRLESQIQSTAKVLDIDLQVVLIYSLCIFSFQDEATHTSETKFIKQSANLDLGKLTDLATLHWEVVHDKIGVQEASQEISKLMRSKPEYNNLKLILIGGLCSAFIGPAAFYSSFVDMLVGFVLGCGLMTIQVIIQSTQSDTLAQVFEIVICGLTSFVSGGLASTKLICYEAVLSSSIVLILPGWLVCCAALELQSRSIISGSVRLIWAVIYALFLGLGISLGAEFWTLFSGKPIELSYQGTCNTSHLRTHKWYFQTVPGWFNFLCVPAFGICLSMRQGARVKTKEFVVMNLLSVSGWTINHFASIGLPNSNQFSSALGSFFVGLVANIYGRLFQGTGFIVALAPILFQLPSGLGHGTGLLNFAKVDHGNSSLLTQTSNIASGLMNGGNQAQSFTNSNNNRTISLNTESAIVNGFQVAQQLIEVSIGLVIGLFMATVLVYPFGNKRGGLMTF